MTVQVEVTTTEVGTTEQVTTVVEVAAIGPELVQIATAGPQGPQGIQGIQGPQGEPGQGILPNGGDTNDVLVKLSADDQDAGWTSEPTFDSLFFDTAAGLEAESTGQLVWDEDAGTIDVGMRDGVTQRVGEDYFYRVQAVEAISKGDLLMAVGTEGNSGLILCAKARPSYDGKDFTSQQLMGLAAAAIAQGERGYALAFGRLRKIDTTDFEEGDILWADPENAGKLTKTRPAAPHWKTIVALVITKSEQVGTLQVRLTFGSSLANDELVNINGIADNYILRYNSANERFEAEALGTAADSDTGDFATAAQGGLADTAVQPGDNISTLTNDENFIDAAGAPVQSVDGKTGTVDLSGDYDALGSASSVQSNLTTHTGQTTNVHGIADTSQLIVEGDSRLSDQRVPTDGSVTSAKIASGGISPASVTGTAVITSDARLSDERTPTDGSVTDAKVSASADIAQSKIAGLTSALDGKANLVGGKVPTSELPALAITSTYVVADITARDALTVQEGDVAIVQDTGSGEPASYIYDGTNWQELLTPTDGVTAVTASEGLASSGGTTPAITIVNGGVTDAKLAGSISPSKITGTAVVDGDARLSEGASTAETVRSLGTGATQALPGDYDVAGQAPVQSVASKTGDVTLTKSDVGLGNVDNTSDLNKPISTATQTALNGKADETTTITAGTGLTGGGDLSANRTLALNAASIASLALADSALQSGDPATDIAYDNSVSGLTATTVQAAIDELAGLLQSALTTE